MLLYPPWRRRVDKKRVQFAHFEPLAQDSGNLDPVNETMGNALPTNKTAFKDIDINIDPVDTTVVAGSSQR